MKVMVVCTTGGSGRRQFGGAEHFLADMIPALARAGIDMVACTPDDEVAAALRGAGVPWISLGARSRLDLGYAREIRRVVGELAPDVVCAHLLSAAMHCRAALGMGYRNTPLVVTLHNSLWQYRDTAPTVRAKAAVQVNISLDLTLRRLRRHTTVAVSEYEAADLRTRGHVRDIRVIPNPLPATWPAPGRTGAPDRSRPVRVGFLGRLEREKGADLLGDIARALPEAEFRIAGTGTVPVPRLPNIELLGQVDAARFLPQLDCVVVPSRVESFGRTALESLSLGVPVVHSGAGGLAEVTRYADGVLGFACDLAPESMAAAVRKATAPGAAPDERLSTARWYQREFAFARIVERWGHMYRSVAYGDR
jgi:glycosyltransferase involved in cell wall biosynthesis